VRTRSLRRLTEPPLPPVVGGGDRAGFGTVPFDELDSSVAKKLSHSALS
jgi:hypothetical protein